MTAVFLVWLLSWTLTQPAPQAPQTAPAANQPQAPAGATITVPARIDFAIAERVYNEAIIRDGNIDRVSKQLEAMCADTARAKRARANACLLRSHIEWRFGRIAPATAAVDAGLAV